MSIKPRGIETFRNNQQETLKNSGFSETIRKELTFNFDLFYKHGQADHVPRMNETFLEWFTGFFDGDGSLGFSKPSAYLRCRNSKIYQENVKTRLRFTITQKEKHIIQQLADNFGFGSVSSWSKNNIVYWRWSLDSKPALERMAHLLNGNLILSHRQNQFQAFIEKGKEVDMFSRFSPKPNEEKPNVVGC